MISQEEINIRKMIVHILDHSLSIPVLSQDEIPSSYEIKEFFTSHIAKTMNDDGIKTCRFNDEENMFLSHLESLKKVRKKRFCHIFQRHCRAII